MRRTIIITLAFLLFYTLNVGAGPDADNPLVYPLYSQELIGGDVAVSALGLFGTGGKTCSGNFDLTGEIPYPARTTIDAAYVVLISRTKNEGPVNIDLSFDSNPAMQQDQQFEDVHLQNYYKTYLWDVSHLVTDPTQTNYSFILSPCDSNSFIHTYGIALVAVISDSGQSFARRISIVAGMEFLWDEWMTDRGEAHFDETLPSGNDYQLQVFVGNDQPGADNESLAFENVDPVGSGQIFTAANGDYCTWYRSSQFSYSGGTGIQSAKLPSWN